MLSRKLFKSSSNSFFCNVQFLILKLPSFSEFERRRDTLIQPFVELKIHQIAFTLAEQFKHFTLLVQLCEETNDMVKLRSLSAAHVGFAEVSEFSVCNGHGF